MRRGVGEQMISASVVQTVKHGGGGVMLVWGGCFAGDTVCDVFRIQGTLNQRVRERKRAPESDRHYNICSSSSSVL